MTRAIRVLHVYKDYFPVLGGIENHIRLLAEAQVRQGMDVTVLVTSLTPRTEVEERAGVRVIKAARLAHVASTPLSLEFFAWLRRLRADIARGQATDIVHLHFPYPPGELGNLLFRPGRRTVITYHSDVVRQQGILRAYNPLLWRVLRGADRIIATSPNYIRTSPYLSRLADKCVVIPLGIELEPFLRLSGVAGEQGGRGELLPPSAPLLPRPSAPLLLFVGRLRYYKGLQYLLEAMREVEAHLLVVGSGPMEQPWKKLARELGVADRVTFVGEVPDDELPAYYHLCDVFVLPASERSEAFGTVQIEAMAAGKPVVCTELGTGTSYVNVHEETGLVVPPRDPAALAAAIRRLLADPELRRRMGERGRERAVREFSAEVMAQRVTRLYEELLG